MREPSRSAVLDTNLLLLWLVGQVDLTLVRTFKRVQDFTPKDYTILRTTLTPFNTLMTTPHVLTETSNFIYQAPPHRRVELLAALERFIDGATEVVSQAREVIRFPGFRALGLTDTALSILSGKATVVTIDYKLCGKIEARGGRCINFNHLRNLEDPGRA